MSGLISINETHRDSVIPAPAGMTKRRFEVELK